MRSDNVYERLFKQQATIGKLVIDGRRNAEEVSRILQAIIDGKEFDVMTTEIFLSPVKQFPRFVAYNNWLQEKYPQHVILEEEMRRLQERLPELGPDDLIFYCHKGDEVLTARLAWEYIGSYRKEIWKSDDIRFNKRYLRPAINEPARPDSFYIKKRPSADGQAIGKRFQAMSIKEVREKLGQDWGMGCEGFQFLGITHHHYPELMDGDKFPFIDLPGLAVAPEGAGNFYASPFFLFENGKLELTCGDVDNCSSQYGSGSLQSPRWMTF